MNRFETMGQARLNSSIVEANLDNSEMQKAREKAEQYILEYASDSELVDSNE